MLKGILFIIAIIVTFDIGKALIDSYREEQALEKLEQSSDPSNSAEDDDSLRKNSTNIENSPTLIESYKDKLAGKIEHIHSVINKESAGSNTEKSNEQLQLENINSPDASTGVIMNLNIPEEYVVEEELDENGESTSFSINGQKDKNTNLKAKPIMTFDIETRTPDVTGVTVEVKKTF